MFNCCKAFQIFRGGNSTLRKPFTKKNHNLQLEAELLVLYTAYLKIQTIKIPNYTSINFLFTIVV